MLTALELRRAFQSGSLSPVEFVPAADPEVGAVTVWAPETAAASSERRYRDGTARLLEGLPYVVKDLLDTEGIVTSYGSALFAGHVPTRSAAAVTRVSAAGALMLGKTTTHEFGWGFATSGEPRTRNPWDLSRTPGGSSGGSAAALATATAPLALGSDTGGSVRVPAAFCGVVGFRPTYGLIDGTGLFPLAPSMDTVGPMARTPADVALLFTALTGDSPTWLTELERNQRDPVRLPGKRIGLLSDTPAAAKLTDLGAHVQPVSIPPAQDFYIPIMVSEALAVHRRLGLLPDRFAEYTPDVQARIQLAEQFSSTEVADANAQRLDLREHLTACFRDVDVLLGPVSSGPPPSLDAVADLRSQLIPWVAPQSLAGLPACVLRAGFDSHGLPVGVQITGKPGADKLVLEIASVLYGTDPDLHTRWPTMRVP